MQTLSKTAKQAIVEKALARNGQTLEEIAKVHNVGRSTLSKWIKYYRNTAIIDPCKSKSHINIPVTERFNHLLVTASLNETELGVYCREQGLYSFQLTQWKEEFMLQPIENKKENLNELKQLWEENKKLKQELRRKDSALAEATALLILKKKADLIWGEIEGD